MRYPITRHGVLGPVCSVLLVGTLASVALWAQSGEEPDGRRLPQIVPLDQGNFIDQRDLEAGNVLAPGPAGRCAIPLQRFPIPPDIGFSARHVPPASQDGLIGRLAAPAPPCGRVREGSPFGYFQPIPSDDMPGFRLLEPGEPSEAPPDSPPVP